jgi:toxin ParE1/3/4
MGGKVVVSPQADADVDKIWFHVAAKNLKAANALAERFAQTSQLLADTPLSGRARPELRKGLRSFPVSSYTIFYLSISAGVLIVRIMHGRQSTDPDDFT